MEWQDTFDKMMDVEQPQWRFDLADEQDMRDWALGRLTHKALTERVRRRLAHVIRVAAVMPTE